MFFFFLELSCFFLFHTFARIEGSKFEGKNANCNVIQLLLDTVIW